MEDKKELFSTAADLWYALREEYSSFEKFSDDFKKYLDVNVELLKSMSETQRLDTLLPIAHNDANGRNVAYSIITTISSCKDALAGESLDALNDLLSVTVDAFSTPNFSEYWTDLYSTIQRFKEKI